MRTRPRPARVGDPPISRAGFDEVYVGQIGPEQREFLEFFERELRPRLG